MQSIDPAAPARAAGIRRPALQGTRTFPFSLVLALAACFALSACGTLTGIPSHGGGKRFATEQRLVSASIRASLKDIDVSALRGKRAALVFDLVADEGGGNLSGGRWTPGLLFSAGSVLSPVTTTSNAFQVFNLADAGSNFNNTTSSGGSSSVSTTQQSGSNTSSGSNTNTSTTTNSGSTSGSSTSTTGGTTTNSSFSQTDSGTSTTDGSGTNTQTGSSTGEATTTSSGSNNTNSRSTGGYSSQRETISPTPSETVAVTEGKKHEHTASLQYRGLGDYQNFNVPKSDASLLMGLVRNYMLFNGVIPTTPTDPSAEVLVYVTVDIFGTVRSRFDTLVYNNETVKAETSFEISAFDREGRMILRPQVANREAQYKEHYLLWAGPLTTQEKVYQGQGLLVDFTDVDGQKATYNDAAPVSRNHLLGKN